jgi:hypothetical protein
MEQIKKYNYNDPLHQKGDPFGATEAKVAHVNAVIDEVNLAKSDVLALDERVYTLENAPAPEAATEYYINGAVIHFVNNYMAVTVDSHNTPVRNIDHLGLGINSYEGVLGFQHSGNGVYAFFFQGTSNIVADIGNGFETCDITQARLSSIIINPDPQVTIALNAAGKPYVGTAIVPYPQADGVADSFIADLSVYAYSSGTNTSTATEIPQPNQARRIFNFQLKFSKFTVVPA